MNNSSNITKAPVNRVIDWLSSSGIIGFAGKKGSKTVQTILEHNKADFILLAKGNTHGGIVDNIYTIPIYGIGKFEF